MIYKTDKFFYNMAIFKDAFTRRFIDEYPWLIKFYPNGITP